jgi:hypothetical protein
MTPRAEVIPHPWVKGAWTVSDALAPGNHIPLFASKAGAEVAASKRNENRRNNDQDCK